MHISMFYGDPDDFIQVVCLQERYQEKLLALGWKKTPEELQAAQEAPAKDEQKESESAFDAVNAIHLMDSKDDIEAYIKFNYGVDLDKRGSLETIKEKAIEIIRAAQPE